MNSAEAHAPIRVGFGPTVPVGPELLESRIIDSGEVRGRPRAISKGQLEAAQALGLSYWRVMGPIALPQAVATNPDWPGFYGEGYVLVGLGFWIFLFRHVPV